VQNKHDAAQVKGETIRGQRGEKTNCHAEAPLIIGLSALGLYLTLNGKKLSTAILWALL
jgi:hypothetical protein